ncbi:TonB-dependent receptor (plasmid) [Catenovulum sp. SX2]|uniref:TonB-dependent receptor n=1 Tax=Catenovulum sp. SX2 TaxID=3398614 RepID=UPI003F872079
MSKLNLNRSLVAATVTSILTMPNIVQAQTNSTAEPAEVIQVKGIRGSLLKSNDVKREAINVVDAITAEDIGKFPDQNLAESLQRITGVSIDRQNGEGTGVTVRGFGPTFNAVRYNNRTIATTNTERNFDFQIIAPELLTGVEVHKSPTADLSEGGIGATINMQAAKPLASPGTKLVISAKGTHQNISGKTSPQISGLYSTTWNDDSMGFLVGVSYSDKQSRIDRFDLQDVGYASTFIDTSDDGVSNDKVKGRHPNKPNFTAEVEERERLSIASTFQWRASDEHTITLDAMLIDFGNFQTRYGTQFSPEGGTVRTNHVQDENGTFVKFTAPNNPNDIEVRPFQDDTKTHLIGFNYQGILSSSLSVAADISYSKAENVHREDQLTPGARFNYEFDATTGNNIPDITTPGTNMQDPALFQAHFVGLREQQRQDSVLEARFDANLDLSIGILETLEAGYFLSDREKSQVGYVNNQNWCGLGCGRNADKFDLPNDLFKPFPFDNFMSQEPGNFPRAWATFDADEFLAFVEENAPDTLIMTKQAGQTFTTDEKSNSLYVKLNLGGELAAMPWSGNFGLRYVNIERTTSGVAQDIQFNSSTIVHQGGSNIAFVGEAEPLTAKKDFDTVLPSLNFKLELSDELILRASASKVMTPPGMSQSSVQMSTSGIFENFVINGSNPQLEPFQAKQFDLGLEYYADNGNAVSLGLFSKDITTGIEQSVTRIDTGYDVPTLGRLFALDNRYQNTDGGKISGFELALLHNFDYLPSPFDGLGIQANYTYAKSSSNDKKDQSDRLDNFALPTEEGVTGFAKNSYNLIAFYEKGDFGMRLAYNKRDRFILQGEGGGGDARYGQAYGQLDMSASYDISEDVAVFFEGTNLTDEGTIREQSYGRIYSVEYAGRRLGAGVRVNFN